MKRAGKIVICLAAALTLNVGARADDAATPADEVAVNDSSTTDAVVLPGNPYAPIVARNVFELTPAPVVDPNAPPAETPLKISPNGIMSIFGRLQVLFKVTGKPDGKTDSYILMEGQRQDDIEVTKIDEKNSLVTFNNHGVVQTLPLANAPSASGGGMTPSFGGSPGAPGFNPNNGNGNNGGGFGRFGQRGGGFGGRNRGGQNGNNLNGNGASDGGGDTLNLRSVPTRNSNLGPSQDLPQMTPEEQVVGIEINRELTKQQVLEGTMPPLPPTQMTPPDATGPGGSPLIAPPAPGN